MVDLIALVIIRGGKESMYTKTKGKLFAVILAFALIFTAIPTGGVMKAEAASKTKVMETKVDFNAEAETGNDSNVLLDRLISKTNAAFGKAYMVNMKIYVPAAFIEGGGSLYLSPSISFYDDNGFIAGAQNANGFSYDFTSDEVMKKGDFYVVDSSIPVETCYDDSYEKEIAFPEGKGKIVVDLFAVGEYCDYKGSIYFDDVELVVDEKVVATMDYEKGDFGKCTYRINSKGRYFPKVVSFSGKALDVSKTKLTVKKGKKATVKATAMPSSKVTFSSSNKKVATVTSKGVVKGIKKGKATITVKGNGKKIKVKVTVK